jgi:hypothetical protein
VPPGPREKRHLRDLDGPLYHDARDCAVVRVTHRCLSLRGRPVATRSSRRAMRGFVIRRCQISRLLANSWLVRLSDN